MPKINVERSVTINANRSTVFASLRDFRQWPVWSPWLICEPDCQLQYDDDGKRYSWDGKIIGAGQMQVEQELPDEKIAYQLTFFKPFKSTASVRFELKETEGGTQVSWIMNSSLPFFMFFFKNMMTGMIGMDYDRGLQMLKDYIEMGSVPTSLEVLGETSFSGYHYFGIRTQCAMKDVGPKMEADFSSLNEKLAAAGIQPTTKPFSIYHEWSFGKGTVEYTIGFPVEAGKAIPDGLISGNMPDCKVYTIKHTGPYRHLGNPWSAGYMRQQAKMFKMNKGMHPFEVYENDPRKTAENELVTLINFPVK
ncbi:MAG: SRPBCC family protein [Verrucomicrobiota bacterium]